LTSKERELGEVTGPSGGWRVGIAGAGWVSQFHLPAWQRQAHRAAVVALADPDVAAMEAQRLRFSVPRGFASAEQMLEAEAIDVLDICAPCEAHAPLMRLAASKGIATLCQKPLATSLAEAEALVGDVGRNVRTMVHDNWRFRASYRRIREWLDEGIAGTLRQVQLDYLSSGMIVDAGGSRQALVRQSNFATMARLLVMEVLIHHLDTLRFLLGELELVAASTARSNDDILGEDIATLTLRRGVDGLPVQLNGNLAAHGEPPQARDQLRIFGSRATITLDGWHLRCVGEVSLEESIDPPAGYQGSYDAAIAHFLDALESGGPFEIPPAEHLKVLALVEAAYAEAGASREIRSSTMIAPA
jgi:D-apiose dehydrogenase